MGPGTPVQLELLVEAVKRDRQVLLDLLEPLDRKVSRDSLVPLDGLVDQDQRVEQVIIISSILNSWGPIDVNTWTVLDRFLA